MIKLLHLEDDVNDHKLLCARLTRDGLEFEIARVDTAESFENALINGCVDLLLSDYNLPGYDATAALRMARKLCPSTPFLIVSGMIGENAAVDIVKQGAIDYVPKEHLEKLVPAIERALREANERKARLEAEEALRHREEALRSELEQLVDRRTQQLMQANEQLQGFTYSVAHDLRQQIRGISANASMVLSDCTNDLDPDTVETLRRLVESSKKLSVLVDDLLDYARLGTHRPKKVNLDLSGLAAEVASHLVERQPYAKESAYRIQPDLKAVGDVTLMRLALENLFDNAFKYASESSAPTVEFGWQGESFYVKDNGIGFDMRYVDKLFQPFERLHTESIYPGTGIGLANVKRIIELHGGQIWAEGSIDNGATFFFTLP